MELKSKQRIVDVRVKTVDKHVPMPIRMFLHSARDSVEFGHWIALNKIYNLYSIKTKKGWTIFYCPEKYFNRPPQIGMFIRGNKKLNQWEICGRSGR